MRKGEHYNPYLQNSWNKYGQIAFDFSILEIVEPEKDKLNNAEQKWMDLLPTLGIKICNTCKAAGTPLGCKRSEETKRKISESKTGKKLQPRTKEHCQSISNSRKGHEVSEATRQKIATSLTGKIQSEETKLKRREALKGKKKSPKTIEKMKIAQKKSPETRAKLSKAHKARILNLKKEGELTYEGSSDVFPIQTLPEV